MIKLAAIGSLVLALVYPHPALAWTQIDLEVGGVTAPRVSAPLWFREAMSWPEVGIPAAGWASMREQRIWIPWEHFDSRGVISAGGSMTRIIRPLGAVPLARSQHYASVVFILGRVRALNQNTLATNATTWWLNGFHTPNPVQLWPGDISGFSPANVENYNRQFFPGTGNFAQQGPHTYRGDSVTRLPTGADLRAYTQMYRIWGAYAMAHRPTPDGLSAEVVAYVQGSVTNSYGVRSTPGFVVQNLSPHATLSDFRQQWILLTSIQGGRMNAVGEFERRVGADARDLDYHEMVEGAVWRTTNPAQVNAIFAAVNAGRGPTSPAASMTDDPLARPGLPGWTPELTATLPGIGADAGYGPWGEWMINFFRQLAEPVYGLADELFWWLREISKWS